MDDQIEYPGALNPREDFVRFLRNQARGKGYYDALDTDRHEAVNGAITLAVDLMYGQIG